jgi:signal transduction histidine kinase
MQLFYLLETSEDDYTRQKLAMLHELMGKTIGDLRSISHTLNTNLITRIGLTDSIDRELEYVRSGRQVKCDLKITGTQFALPPEKELLIFRIAQEAISNILRHAGAKNIHVLLSYESNSFTLSIADDGIGFDPDTLAEGKGIGLINMYERAKILQGTLTIKRAAENGGSIISLTVNHQPNGVSYQNSDSR